MPSRTLLNHTLSRVESVLDVIDALEHTDFPYQDSKDALKVIREQFSDAQVLLRDQPDESDLNAVGTACNRALEQVFMYLPLIGFIARSANTEGAPELHGPLRRLTASIIGASARLVMSSEWDYSPYTTFYPPLARLKFVVVGLPRSESGNALAAPIAGHELGHNIWIQKNYGEFFRDRVRDTARNTAISHWTKFSEYSGLTDTNQLDDLLGQGALSSPYQFCLLQIEELFCDLLGLYLFGESFLLAFQYLLSPGTGRIPSTDGYHEYPTIKERVKVLERAAKEANIRVPHAFVQSFTLDEQSSWPALLADESALKLVPELASKAREVLGYGSSVVHDEKEIDSHTQRFLLGFPACGASTIAHLINAAWRAYEKRLEESARNKIPNGKSLPMKQLINEILLKSIEVYEIEQRQKKTS